MEVDIDARIQSSIEYFSVRSGNVAIITLNTEEVFYAGILTGSTPRYRGTIYLSKSKACILAALKVYSRIGDSRINLDAIRQANETFIQYYITETVLFISPDGRLLDNSNQHRFIDAIRKDYQNQIYRPGQMTYKLDILSMRHLASNPIERVEYGLQIQTFLPMAFKHDLSNFMGSISEALGRRRDPPRFSAWLAFERNIESDSPIALSMREDYSQEELEFLRSVQYGDPPRISVNYQLCQIETDITQGPVTIELSPERPGWFIAYLSDGTEIGRVNQSNIRFIPSNPELIVSVSGNLYLIEVTETGIKFRLINQSQFDSYRTTKFPSERFFKFYLNRMRILALLTPQKFDQTCMIIPNQQALLISQFTVRCGSFITIEAQVVSFEDKSYLTLSYSQTTLSETSSSRWMGCECPEPQNDMAVQTQLRSLLYSLYQNLNDTSPGRVDMATTATVIRESTQFPSIMLNPLGGFYLPIIDPVMRAIRDFYHHGPDFPVEIE